MKKLPVVCFGVVTAMMSPMAMANVSLELGEGTNLIAVNGQELDRDERPGRSNPFRLANGTNQLLVEHTAEISDSADEAILDTSSTHVLLLEAVNARLSLQAPEITSRHEMRAFNDATQWRLVNDEGESIDYVSAVLKKEGLQFGRDYEAELKRFNRSGDPAALPGLSGAEKRVVIDTPIAASNTAVSTSIPSSTALGDSGMSDQAMVGKMLKFWYQQASPTTRSDFRRWIEKGQ